MKNITDEKRYRHRLEQRRYVERIKKEGRKPSQGSKESREKWLLSHSSKEIKQKYFSKNPWAKHYGCARARTCFQYGSYFERGLKFSMTLEDFKELWFRDKAYEFVRPSIDRIYSDVGYEKWNCRYIELKENMMRKRIFWNTQLSDVRKR